MSHPLAFWFGIGVIAAFFVAMFVVMARDDGGWRMAARVLGITVGIVAFLFVGAMFIQYGSDGTWPWTVSS